MENIDNVKMQINLKDNIGEKLKMLKILLKILEIILKKLFHHYQTTDPKTRHIYRQF